MSQAEICFKTKDGLKDNIDTERRAFIKTAALAGGTAVVAGIPLTSYFIRFGISRIMFGKPLSQRERDPLNGRITHFQSPI